MYNPAGHLAIITKKKPDIRSPTQKRANPAFLRPRASRGFPHSVTHRASIPSVSLRARRNADYNARGNYIRWRRRGEVTTEVTKVGGERDMESFYSHAGGFCVCGELVVWSIAGFMAIFNREVRFVVRRWSSGDESALEFDDFCHFFVS